MARVTEMKIFAMILLLVLVSQFMGNSHAAATFGICTLKGYNNMVRPCMTTFYQSFRKDPQASCSVKFVALFGCFQKAVLKCMPNWNEDQARNNLYNSNIREKRYCEDAGIQGPALYPVDRSQFPCSDTYFQNIPGCYNETMKLFRSNKGDPRLCRSYAESTKCDKFLLDTECRYTGVVKEELDLTYDGYNPFCNAVAHHLSKGVPFLIWAVLITLVIW